MVKKINTYCLVEPLFNNITYVGESEWSPKWLKP